MCCHRGQHGIYCILVFSKSFFNALIELSKRPLASIYLLCSSLNDQQQAINQLIRYVFQEPTVLIFLSKKTRTTHYLLISLILKAAPFLYCNESLKVHQLGSSRFIVFVGRLKSKIYHKFYNELKYYELPHK